MKRLLVILTLIFILGSFGVIHAEGHPNDNPGSKDPPLFNRMPNYFIYVCEENDFNKFDFPIAKNKTNPVEGRYYHVAYQMVWGEKTASPVAILRNYQNAVKAIGGQVVYELANWETVLKVSKNGSEFWVDIKIVSEDGSAYEVFMVEKQGMGQDIVANADGMAQSIKQSGKVALYGIHFDTGKADVKPDSESALQEIAKLLKADPKLKIYVVGHTDNVGGFDANLKLSKDRADAVVKVLTTKYGIAASRLIAFGDGPVAPVASNATEDGRAQNRRVELVAQ